MTLEAVPHGVREWIEVSDCDTALVISIGGELDTASRATIEPAVLAAIESSPSVILDLEGLTFCDSRGLTMFVIAHERAIANGTAFAVRRVQPPVRRLFEITNIDTVIDVIEWAGP
jgi:anti-sigma B factor antagonist